MIRPCPICKKEVYDGLPCPPNSDPERMRKSHKICASCLPEYNLDVEAQMEEFRLCELSKKISNKMLRGAL